MEDIELRRNDEVYLDALGAQRIPDPTTAGDFCRRFEEDDVESLMDTFNKVRLKVWRQQPDAFFEGSGSGGGRDIGPNHRRMQRRDGRGLRRDMGLSPTVDFAGEHGRNVYLVNRAATGPRMRERPNGSIRHRVVPACGVRSDPAARGHRLQPDPVFGWMGRPGRGLHLRHRRDEKPGGPGRPIGAGLLGAPGTSRKYEVASQPRQRPDKVKERIVRERGFENIRLRGEDVAEFAYRPGACDRDYRVVVVRKNLSVAKGEQVLFDDIRYFFYITNRADPADQIVMRANQRCNQENLIEQLKNGVHALGMPVGDQTSNWAYMVMASLAWTLKAWFALLLPETGRWGQKYQAEKQTVLRMEFKTFLNAFMLGALPARAYWSAHRLPADGLEPVVASLVSCRGCVASTSAMLTRSWI